MPITKYDSQIRHSLYGRKLGLDGNDFLVGEFSGSRTPTEIVTTANAATPLTGYGASALTGSTAAYLLAAPAAVGIEKIVVNASTLSTAIMSLVRSTANGACAFAGSSANGAATGVKITLTANGCAVRLMSFTTDAWTPVGVTVTSSAQAISITTSS